MSKTTREIEKQKNKNMLLFAILCSILITIGIVSFYDDLQYHYETKVVKLEIGCVMGGYPTHSNMICEDGVQGDIANNYNSIIWYCGEFGKTKTCLYKEILRVRN